VSRLWEQLTGLWLLDPWMLLLAFLVPLALFARRRSGLPALVFAPAPFLEGLPRSLRSRLGPLPYVCGIIGMLLLVLALARPVIRRPLPLESAGIDIMLCLDTSSSMATRDMDPRRSRLDLAREAASRFVSGRRGDRIGLFRFARYPDLLCPLTLDRKALLELLRLVTQVEPDSPEDRTGIGTVVARAAQVLRRSEASSRVVILFTDGKENVATARTPDEIGPARAGALCAALGVRVYVIAAGEGRRGPDGELVPIDTGQIEELARVTRGRFFRARDADAVKRVYTLIDALEKSERQEPRYRMEERFHLFLAAALVLFLLGRLGAFLAGEALP